MRDSKLKSKDLIKIRLALGGGEKATTQTARIARKLAEQTAKRNKITLSVTPDKDWYDELVKSPQTDTLHTARIKRGGVPIAIAELTYHRGGNRWGGKVSSPMIDVGHIGPAKDNRRDRGFIRGDMGSVSNVDHAQVANKVLKKADVKRAMLEIKKKFPKAETVKGHRVTGMRDNLYRKLQQDFYEKQGSWSDYVDDPETDYDNYDDTVEDFMVSEQKMKTQTMKLPKLPPAKTRLEKALAHSSTRLKGAMRGVEMLPAKLSKAIVKATPSAPLEAAATTYAQTGSAPAAASSAATTTAFGAGIRKAFITAAKHAPVVARVAGRAAAPLAVATAGYDLFRAGQEGTKAYQAKQDALKNEKYMSDNYGSIEAATATRRRRHESRNPL